MKILVYIYGYCPRHTCILEWEERACNTAGRIISLNFGCRFGFSVLGDSLRLVCFESRGVVMKMINDYATFIYQ